VTDNPFPTDDATLVMLIAACEINPDTGQTHLHQFLDMGTREKSRTQIDDMGGIPVFDVEYEEGYEPFSEHQVIRTLAGEILEMRGKWEQRGS
jgi:uncharacterized protein YehS (DUF1456 family)